MIEIGVNENVVLSQVLFNDQQSLEIYFSDNVSSKSLEEQLLDTSDAGNTSFGTKFIMYPPSTARSNVNLNDDAIAKNFLVLKKQLIHILKAISPSPLTGKEIDIIKDLTKEQKSDLLACFGDAEIREKLYNSLTRQFEKIAIPLIGKERVRVFGVRASKAKAYPSFRTTDLDMYPFMEKSNVAISESLMYQSPTTKSTVKFEPIVFEDRKYVPKFSEYEIKNDKDNSAKTDMDSSTQETYNVDNNDVETVFTAE